MERLRIQRASIHGLSSWILRRGDLLVEAIPGLGGKIARIAKDGHEFLFENPTRRMRLAAYGAPYADYDASGFDECLPTVGPCSFPDYPWEGTPVPDHGEVWSIPWASRVDAGGLSLWTHGVRFPYRFEKRLELVSETRLSIEYLLTNHAPVPFRYIWSSHPLFEATPGMRVLLPEGTSVRIDWSRNERLGAMLDEHPWPVTVDRSGRSVDLSLVPSRDRELVDKLFTTRLDDGWCGLHDPAEGWYVILRFPLDRVPYVGLSLNFGGWPTEGEGYFNIGLEPCSGFPDRLDVALERGDYAVAQSGATVRWNLTLDLGRSATPTVGGFWSPSRSPTS